jgi:hypothetical protein
LNVSADAVCVCCHFFRFSTLTTHTKLLYCWSLLCSIFNFKPSISYHCLLFFWMFSQCFHCRVFINIIMIWSTYCILFLLDFYLRIQCLHSLSFIIHWLIDWWMIVWLISWLVGWLIHWFIDSLIFNQSFYPCILFRPIYFYPFILSIYFINAFLPLRYMCLSEMRFLVLSSFNSFLDSNYANLI